MIFLAASTNNKANTVFSLFMGEIERFGLSERVGGDQGVGNVVMLHGSCSQIH